MSRTTYYITYGDSRNDVLYLYDTTDAANKFARLYQVNAALLADYVSASPSYATWDTLTGYERLWSTIVTPLVPPPQPLGTTGPLVALVLGGTYVAGRVDAGAITVARADLWGDAGDIYTQEFGAVVGGSSFLAREATGTAIPGRALICTASFADIGALYDVVLFEPAAACIFTLPDASLYPGKPYTFVWAAIGSADLPVIAAFVGQTVGGNSTYPMITNVGGQGGVAWFVSDGVSNWIPTSLIYPGGRPATAAALGVVKLVGDPVDASEPLVPVVESGPFNGPVTTGLLVGRTITVVNGLIVDFS